MDILDPVIIESRSITLLNSVIVQGVSNGRKKRAGLVTVLGVVVLVVAVVIVWLVMAGGGDRQRIVEYRNSDFAVNVDDPRALVGFADHYFVATVKSVGDRSYRNEVTVKSTDGMSRSVAEPYTTYTLSVIKNIKGELPTNHDVQVTKAGGVSKDGKSVVLYEGDALMDQGKTYVVLASVQPDGTLLVSGPNSNKLVESSDGDYGTFQAYYDNQIPYDRDRFTYK